MSGEDEVVDRSCPPLDEEDGGDAHDTKVELGWFANVQVTRREQSRVLDDGEGLVGG